MLIEQLKEAKRFTNHEKDVARYILGNIEEACEMTSSELAKASYTSKSTIVRLSKKLGLKGYTEFKLKLVAEVNQQNRIRMILANEPITSKSTSQDIIKVLPALYDKSITNTRLTLNRKSIDRIHSVLKNTDKIDIYGTGISYLLAQSVVFKYATLGIDCSAYESINAHALSAKQTRRTVSFLTSFTGANKITIQIAEYLQKATNNYVVGIVGPHHEEIKKWCDEIIEIPNRDSILSLDVITSFAAANYVFDIFFGLILSDTYQEHIQSSLEILNFENLLLDKNSEKYFNTEANN